MQQINSVPENANLWKQKKTHSSKISSQFVLVFLGEQKGVYERMIKADTKAEFSQYWVRNVTYHSLDTNKIWWCLIQNRISGLVWLKTFFRYHLSSWSHNPLSNLVDLKYTLLYKCTTFSASRLIQCFLKLTRTSSTRYDNTMSKQIGSKIHILIHWLSQTLGLCRRCIFLSIQGLGHSNTYPIY